MNQEQINELFELCKEFELEKSKLQPSPFGGYQIGITGGGFISTHKQLEHVTFLKGKVTGKMEEWNPSFEEVDIIKKRLDADQEIIEERKRLNVYFLRTADKLPKIMNECNKAIANSFSHEEILKAEERRTALESEIHG